MNPDLVGIPGFGKSGIPVWSGSRDSGNRESRFCRDREFPSRCRGIGDFGVWLPQALLIDPGQVLSTTSTVRPNRLPDLKPTSRFEADPDKPTSRFEADPDFPIRSRLPVPARIGNRGMTMNPRFPIRPERDSESRRASACTPLGTWDSHATLRLLVVLLVMRPISHRTASCSATLTYFGPTKLLGT